MQAYSELEKHLIEALQEQCTRADTHPNALEDISILCSHENMRCELIGLVHEFHHQPTDQLAGMIRQRLLEMRFIDDTGDSVVDAPQQELVELEVTILVSALEKMRQRAIQHGLWGQAEACVPCCG